MQNIHHYLRSARFTWADKIALLTTLLFSLLFLFLWSLTFFVVGGLGTGHLWGSFGVLGIELGILIVGTIWFAMRAAGLLAGWFSHRLFFRLAP
jgi:hypothetical protein